MYYTHLTWPNAGVTLTPAEFYWQSAIQASYTVLRQLLFKLYWLSYPESIPIYFIL